MNLEYPDKIYAQNSRNSEYYDFGDYDTDKSLFSSPCEYIRADLVPKWHKDAEEEPNKATEYLVTVIYDDNDEYDVVTALWTAKGWALRKDIADCEVTAWQELPKPYIEE